MTDGPQIVNWGRAARRLRVSAIGAVAIGLIGWGISSVAGGPGFGTWLGIVLALVFVAEVVVVGGSALRGMFRAGERGERLAGNDVGILPARFGNRNRRGGT